MGKTERQPSTYEVLRAHVYCKTLTAIAGVGVAAHLASYLVRKGGQKLKDSAPSDDKGE